MPSSLAMFLIVTINTYRQSWYTYLGAVGILGYRISEGVEWGPFDTFLAFYMVFPLLFAMFAPLFNVAGRRYRKLIDAVSWGRWEEVLARVDSVGGRMPPEEIAFQKAKALAGLGRLDEALRLVKPFGDGVKLPARSLLVSHGGLVFGRAAPG